ncbi:hypothetical protein C8J57DRAFT_1530245 [Mycena rebaudengoi]|nr:hypothetical protein C8J57DRAFT_1530245 [Mycena rebaudengoi]
MRDLQEEVSDDGDTPADNEDSADDFHNLQSVLDGTTRIELSHSGGEFSQLFEDDSEEELAPKPKTKPTPDYRTRTDRTDRLIDAWNLQMDVMVEVYMFWAAEIDFGPQRREGPTPEVPEIRDILVVDIYETHHTEVEPDAGGKGVAAALIKQGLVPCTPYEPTLASQSFCKSLSDLHGTAYRPYLGQQFTICYDLYLEMCRRTDQIVLEVLDRNSPSYRLRHACPACMYKLEGEDTLIFALLTTMDRNDSLKRVLRRMKVDDKGDGDEPVLGETREKGDKRDGGEDYYISQEKVDAWAKARLGEVLPTDPTPGGADNPCPDHWKNMVNDVTSKTWGIFDETGIFLALCRHGFVLVVADMIRSGELAKYPLAVVEALLDVFGLNIGLGYDIGCHFGATVNKSPMGEHARANQFKALVSSFHGHAHNRRCQLGFLATYVAGMGLEDLEGCERYFSKSNGLARSVRYASRFHRKQEITTYMKHMDSFETYANLSKFLCSNYRQAIQILKEEPALHRWMGQEGVVDYQEFHKWLNEEKEYLAGLDTESVELKKESLEMEYVQKLVNLSVSEAKVLTIQAAECAVALGDGTYSPAPVSYVARRHAIEKRDRHAAVVEELEEKLDIRERWTSEDVKWVAAVKDIKQRKYQLALDELEKLIVARIFELTNMNQSQTGYKMRKHIAKALQVRSKEIRSSLTKYNLATISLDPPMRQLSWEEVVEYTFLADFDILRDTRDSIQSKPWTRPAYRLALDKYFRIQRAAEEIKRLNIKIRRHVTWIDDEDVFLKGEEKRHQTTNPPLACQISQYRQERSRSDGTHMRRYWALAKTPGFTGTLIPGVSVEKKAAKAASRAAAMDVDGDVEEVVDRSGQWGSRVDENEWTDDDDEGEDAEEEAMASTIYTLDMLSIDATPLRDDGEV